MGFIKKVFFLFFPVFSLAPVQAVSKPGFSLELAPHFGLSYGHLDEYIYSSADDSIARSLLEWELHPLCALGLDMKAGWKNFYALPSASIALPFECGTMRDSDWNSAGNTKIIYSELEEKNTLSFSASFELGYSFIFDNPFDKNGFKSRFSVSPAASFSYSYFKIKSDNGHGYFGSEDYSSNGEEVAWDSGYATYHRVYGINLVRQYFSVFAGLRLSADMTHRLNVSAGVFVSPYTCITTFDRHLKKRGSYRLNGRQEGCLEYWKFDFGAEYSFTRRLSLAMEAELLKGNLLKGDFYHNYYSSKPEKSRQKSGSATFVFSADLGIKIRVL